MKKSTHTATLIMYPVIIALAAIYLAYLGYSYYSSPLEERFYNSQHEFLKPSGILGHGLGIIGTLMILTGVSLYIARKRFNFLVKYLRLKHLLEFHIFLCTLGPVLILFHTAFKFGGIVSVAFWSMVAVVISGVIGRFIYIQIPRTIEGRELSLNELQNMRTDLAALFREKFNLKADVTDSITTITNSQKNESNNNIVRNLKTLLKENKISRPDRKSIIKIVKNEISLSGKISRLQKMQSLFKYWHVAHLPFALIMLIIAVIHVVIAVIFGYKWIF